MKKDLKPYIKDIDFTKYPKIWRYWQHLKNPSLIKVWKFSILEEEDYVKIMESWIDEYEKSIDNAVNNTLIMYKMFGQSMGGHQSLKENHEVQRNEHYNGNVTKDFIRQEWDKCMLACLSHFYQSWIDETDKKYCGGAVGCGMSVSFDVTVHNHTEKKYRYNLAGSFNMVVALTNAFWNEFDIVGIQ